MKLLRKVLAIVLFKAGCWFEIIGMQLEGTAPTQIAYCKWRQKAEYKALKEALG